MSSPPPRTLETLLKAREAFFFARDTFGSCEHWDVPQFVKKEIEMLEKEKKILESPKAEEYMKLKLEHQEAIEAREAMRKEYSEKCALVNSKEQELAKF